MKEAKKFLKNSLIYQMSLGSKELFHSNVWAWLIDRDHDVAKVFFGEELNGYEVLKVDREYLHRDIIIWLQSTNEHKEKGYLVIENKIKSLPTKEQLKKYTKDLNIDKLKGAVYTGLVNPFIKQPIFKINEREIIWRFVGYNEISKNIRYVVEKSKEFNLQEKIEINEYCSIAESIGEILSLELKNKENRLSFSYDADKDENKKDYIGLKDLRINDLFVKMKGADFFSKMQEELKTEIDIGEFVLECWQSFNNGNATLDFRYSNRKENSSSWLKLGVQIEGSQYRLVAERNKYGAKNNDCESVYTEFTKCWFDENFDRQTNTKVFDKKTSMKPKSNKKYNKYDGDDYCMVYQYYDITEENNSYEYLVYSIKQDLIKAKEIIRTKIIPNLGQ